MGNARVGKAQDQFVHLSTGEREFSKRGLIEEMIKGGEIRSELCCADAMFSLLIQENLEI